MSLRKSLQIKRYLSKLNFHKINVVTWVCFKTLAMFDKNEGSGDRPKLSQLHCAISEIINCVWIDCGCYGCDFDCDYSSDR